MSREARIVIAELPLVRTVADIGLAVGLAPGIEGVFGRDGIAMAENDGAAVGDPGDPAVARRIVEDLETQAQRIEDHFETYQTDQQNGRQPGAHQVTPRAGMPAGIGEKRIDQAENGDDHPLGLHVTAECREQEKNDERHGDKLQRTFDGVLRLHGDPGLHVQRHEEGIEDHQQVEQVFGDIIGPEHRITPRQMIGQRGPVVLVLPHEMRHEQQQRYRAAEI